MYAPGEMRKDIPARKATMIRLEPDLHEQVAEIARMENRSINQQIAFYIRKGLASDKQKGV